MRRALTLITKRGMAATKTHYDRVAASYHDAYFYSDAYEMWQRDEVLRRLQLQPHHRVADIGGGTGRFVGLLKDAAGLSTKPICVDPSASMLEACERKDVAFVQSDARAYVDDLPPKALDRVLLKEVVQHFGDDELASICAGLHKALDGNGRVVVCTDNLACTRAADKASRTSASSASQGLSSAGALLVDVEVLSMIYSAPQLIMSGAALIDGSAALRGAQRVSSNE